MCGALLCCAVAIASAQNQIFDAKGFDSQRATFSQLPFEHIDPLTGNLILTFTDLVLPGNAGFDLRIQRTYNSKIQREFPASEAPREDSWAGLGWTLHFGRVLNWSYQDSTPPIIEMPDGSQHPTFHHISPPSGCYDCYITREFWIYDKSDYTLTLPNGTRYVFGHVGTAHITPTGVALALYTDNIFDPFGNAIDVSYFANPSDAVSSVTQHVSGQTRTVTFTVTSTAMRSLSSMTYQGRTWTYTQINHGQYADINLLTAVDPPVGPGWSFAYKTTSIGYHALIHLETPNGGVIDYQYGDELQYIGQPVVVHTISVTNRSISGRDVVSGSWTYAYAQGSAKNQTVVTGPCSDVVTYSFQGVGNYSTTGDAWRVGLPSGTTISSGGTTLQTEQLTWIESAPISPDDQTIGYNGDLNIFVPLLSTRAVTRGSVTLTTTNSYHSTNFNDYARPWQSAETGQLQRTTARTFQYGFGPYIVDKIASETVTVSGQSFTKSYSYESSTGFMSSQNIYGVTTTFDRTSAGDVWHQTNARSKTTTYGYQWGQVSSEQTPEFTITRSINSDGTIAAETRRGFTTSFQYDSLQRITQQTPHIGTAVTTTYDNSSGTYVRRTRGSSVVTTFVNGFGNVSNTENAVGVKTDFTYDACGRTTYQSYPYTNVNIGTTIAYDALSRVTRQTHPDSRFITYAYNGLNITVTDENNRQTTRVRQAFGDPADARLTSFIDASGQTTSYTYNAVGSLTEVSQPGVGDRTWTYNEKNQLISESHPESGQTTYQRDPVGNMSSRTTADFQTTSYTYDGNDRLTFINYPNLADDVTIEYDASDNRTALSNSYVTSTMHYDAVNRLIDRIDVIDGKSFTTGYTYYANDTLQTINYPTGRTVAYTYDAENRVMTVTNGGAVTYADQFSYHPSGAITSYRAGNNLVHTQTFDNRYRVSTLNAGGALSLTYGYDDAGNVNSISDSRPGMNQTFGYDSLERLTSVSGWNAANYTYDGRGNRLSKSGPNATNYNYNSTTNRLTSSSGAQQESFGYDQTGNVTSDGSGSYTYTPENMLESATVSGATTTYRYDGDNVRVMKGTAGSNGSFYVHGPNSQLLSEFHRLCGQPRAARDYIYAGGRMVASVRFPDPLPTATVTTGSSRAEYVGNATVAVTVTTSTGEPLACAATIQYATTNGTAVAGADYVSVSGNVTFAAGTSSGTALNVAVPITADGLDEDDETFVLALTNATAATLGQAAHTVTIQDIDSPPTVTISDVTVVEGDSTASATFTLSLSSASGRSVSVAYVTANNSAFSGSDYTSASGTVTFAAGVTTRDVIVSVLGDTIEEFTENFSVNLSNPTNVFIGDSQGWATITDDDARPAATINDVSISEGQSGTANASFTVTLSFASVRTITVDFATANGSAIAGHDYLAQSGTATFAPGVTTRPIVISVLGDAIVENTEGFAVNLSNPVWTTISDNQGAGTIVNDDVFTDATLQATVTAVRLVHINELRANINALRALYGLAAFAWTDPTLTTSTIVKGAHLTELRTALNAVYQAAGLPLPSYTDPVITAGATSIRAVHINELRAAIIAVP